MTNEQIYRSTIEEFKTWLDSIITTNANQLNEGTWSVPASGIVSQFNVARKILEITDGQWIESMPLT